MEKVLKNSPMKDIPDIQSDFIIEWKIVNSH